MIIRNVTEPELLKALGMVNKKYGDNICWNNFRQEATTTFRVTLKVKDSKKAGHRIGIGSLMGYGNKRRLSSACWHVHGDFFDALFEVQPKATVQARKKTISINGGNWEDDDIGSMMHPVVFSEACECEGRVKP